MAIVAILQPDARSEARLSAALSTAHDVALRRDWDSLTWELEQGTLDACVIDADHPSRESASDRISEIRERFPTVAVVVCVEGDRASDYFGFGGMGVAGVVGCGSRPSQLRADFDDALSATRAENVARLLRGRLPAPGPAVLAWAMEHAGPETSVARLATALGYTPRELRNALQDSDLPSPVRMLLFGRLLVASARLGDDRRKVEDVAFSLGYATATSFQRAMKIHTGLTAAQVSRRGGLSLVIDTLFPGDGPSGGGRTSQEKVSAPLATFAMALLLSGCATLGLAGPGVDGDAIDRVVGSPPIEQLHVGVLAIDASSGRTLYNHNGQRKFIPASNQKILVTATALSLLGPDFRFRTEVWATGPSVGAVLDGDVVLVASGDPSLSGRYWPSGTAALRALADSLRAEGIEYIAGSAIVDASAWDSTTVGPTREVEDLRYTYGATGGIFAIDEGEIEIVLRAGASDVEPVQTVWSPLGGRDFVVSDLRTAPADSGTRVRPHYLPESRRLVLDGRVEQGTVDTVDYALRDPVRQATAALGRAIHREGIDVEGGMEIAWTEGAPMGRGCTAGSVDTCAGARLIQTFESPPLSELVAGILEPSQNWMTEQLVLALGARFGSEGSWSEGVDVVEAYLIAEVGVPPLDISARDGSGLSAYNLVTPRAIVRILKEMRDGPYADIYRTAMAEPGEDDSTLRRRLPELEGRLFAKTGTISNVNSLSGYLVGEDGREIIFSILTNGSGLPASRVRDAIDQIVTALARP